MKNNQKFKLSLSAVVLGAFIVPMGSVSAADIIHNSNGTTTITFSPHESSASAIDFANAKPMPLPTISRAPARNSSATPASGGSSGFSPGGGGNGQKMPVQLIPSDSPSSSSSSSDGFSSQEHGTQEHPYTTTRVDLYGRNYAKANPFRRAGKLFFNNGGSSFVCSASTIKPGVVVTAAHCVADFGNSTFYTNFQYVPGYKDGSGLFGTWTGTPTIMTSYFNGTETCAVSGVVCPNDIAVIKLTAQGGQYAGNLAGWFGYNWGGYGFTPADEALITQLGYPVSHDSGLKMQRTDSQSFADASLSDNNIIGSRQTGGSSGGPWVVNLGQKASFSGTSPGSESGINRVVGVTSWGYVSDTPKQQGASPFLSSNIVVLVDAVCPPGNTDPACN